MTARWDEIKQLWQQNQFLFAVAGFLMGLLTFPFLERFIVDTSTLLGDLVPETFGIIFTVVVIDRLYRSREKERRIENLKRQLVMDASSLSNEKAKDAVHQLTKRKWIVGTKGLLKEADLTRANLKHVILFEANLAGADLRHAILTESNLERINLSKAQLSGANLERVNLGHARLIQTLWGSTNLERANLEHANLVQSTFIGSNLYQVNLEHSYLIKATLYKTNLETVNFRGANLENADLSKSNLSGAILHESNLMGTNLADTTFDSQTVLPDANLVGYDENNSPIYDKFWTSETDMTQYTDSNHPDFWQPDWAKNKGSTSTRD